VGGGVGGWVGGWVGGRDKTAVCVGGGGGGGGILENFAGEKVFNPGVNYEEEGRSRRG